MIDPLANDRPTIFGEHNQFVLTSQYLDVNPGKKYLTNFVYTYNQPENNGHSWFREDGSKAIVEIYKLPRVKKVKEIDLYAIAESYGKDYGILRINQIVYQDMDYLVLQLVKKNKKNPHIATGEKDILLNIDTEEVQDLPTELQNNGTAPSFSPFAYYNHYMDAVSQTTLEFKIKEYGLSFYKGLALRYLPDNYSENEQYFIKKSSQINLFKENPDFAKQIFINDDKNKDNDIFKAEAIYARLGLVSDEEWFNTLLHWFSESETEDLTVYPLDSEGNPIESAPIKSYADYQAWKAAHPDIEKGGQ